MKRNQAFSLCLLLAFSILCGRAQAFAASAPRVDVVLWFDTEDYLLPASDDAAKRLAEILTQRGIRATFKVVGEKARALERRGRTDVIAALRKHDIGYHSDFHSVHPAPAEYLSDCGFLDGVGEFARRERRGAADVRRIFDRESLACYGQPGSSWASQAIAALPQIGVAPVYLDEGRQVGLDNRPFWYAGALNVFGMGENFTRMNLYALDGLAEGEAKVSEAVARLSADGGGLVSIMYHPCEFVHGKFWDAVNFARGANPPREKWQLPPQRPAAETEAAFARFTKYIDYLKGLNVRFVTASELPAIYADRARSDGLTEAELLALAKKLADPNTAGVDSQVFDGKSVSPADQFELLTTAVAQRIAGKNISYPIVTKGLLGPDSAPGAASDLGETIAWPAFRAAVSDVADYLQVHRRVPPRVFIGADSVAPADFLAALAYAYEFEHDHAKLPLDGVRLGKHLAVLTERHVARNSPAVFEWKIHREGFMPHKILDVARLQAWTLKPALRCEPASETAAVQETFDKAPFRGPNITGVVRPSRLRVLAGETPAPRFAKAGETPAPFFIAGETPAPRFAKAGETPAPLELLGSLRYSAALDREYESSSVYRLTYPSPVVTALKQNNTITAEFYLPKGIRKDSTPRPAVICLHILGGGFELTQLQCTALARRGIPAIWFKLPYYGERGPPEGTRALAANPRLFTEAVKQGLQDVRRTVDVLASRPEVDRRHIGIMGVSLGGILAATSAAEEPRISRAVLILSGGDLLPIVHHTHETQRLSEAIRRLPDSERAAVEQAITSADPLEHAADLRDRAMAGRVLMINAAEDEVIPRASTEKLAAALGIKDRVVWLDGLGHYTAIAALPQALKQATEFFARDLPPDASPPPPLVAATPRQALMHVWRQCWQFIGDEPKDGRCHLADFDVHVALKDGKKYDGSISIARGPKTAFSVTVKMPGLIDSVGFGNAARPWLASKGNLFLGAGPLANVGGEPSAGQAADSPGNTVGAPSPEFLRGLEMAKGLANAVAMAPEMLDQWISIEEMPPDKLGERRIRVVRRGAAGDELRLSLADDRSPVRLEVDYQGTHITLIFHAFRVNSLAQGAFFEPPQGCRVKQVPSAELAAMFGAGLNLAAERIRPPAMPRASLGEKIVARDPAGHGLLCEFHGKRLLFVEGTPDQMGAAHGRLLRNSIAKLTGRTVYGIGAADTVASGVWWFDRTNEIERRAGPHIPPRFLVECDAMARAAGLSPRDARAANFFPERFHCSGVAVRGKATVGGRVLHARVLDYMRDIGLQNHACVAVFMPQGRNAWISAGYAGFIGTVTAMNERGLAIGEMGGRGEGQWDGVPMSFLLRDVMERAATVEEALAILRASPRTCEYYYVISDKHRDMAGVYCTPQEVQVLRPGQQHPRLPRVPEDTVLMSAGSRAEALSERIQKSYGQIDVAKMIEIIKRPVAMNSNLHQAIFSPETLEIWIADAGATTPACDEPYARFNLAELLEYFRRNK